jgi:hypothetical protein
MRTHRARRFGIGSDDFNLEISLQKSPYYSSSYQSLAGFSPMLITDWSKVQILLGPPFSKSDAVRFELLLQPLNDYRRRQLFRAIRGWFATFSSSAVSLSKKICSQQPIYFSYVSDHIHC